MARAMVPLHTIRYQCSYIHVIAGTAKPAGKRGRGIGYERTDPFCISRRRVWRASHQLGEFDALKHRPVSGR